LSSIPTFTLLSFYFPGLFAYHSMLLFYVAISDGALERASIFGNYFVGWLVGRIVAFICLNVII